MDCAFMLWLFAVSVVARAFGRMLGMAGGIFIVPILTMFGHVEIHTAIGASIVSVIVCSCGGAAPFLENGTTNVRLAIVLETATTMGALTGVLLAGMVPSACLYALFTAILFLSARQMLARRRDPLFTSVPAATKNWLDSSYPDQELGSEVLYRVHRVLVGMTLMYGAGRISALFAARSALGRAAQ